MKSSHSVKILAAEIEKLFISHLKGKKSHCGGCLSFGAESHFCQLLCFYAVAGSSEMFWQAGWGRADALLPTASLCQGRCNEGHSSSLLSPWDMGITTVLLRAPFAPLQPVSNAMADSPPSPLEALNCLDRNHGCGVLHASWQLQG